MKPIRATLKPIRWTRHAATGALAALVAVGAACAPPEEPAETAEEAASPAELSDEMRRSGVDDLRERWVQAYHGGDPEVMVGLYADDAVLLPPGQFAVKGDTAILTWFADAFAEREARFADVPELTLVPENVRIAGDRAWEWGAYTVTGALASGETGAETGKYVTVAERIAGDWKMVLHIWNENEPRAE